MRPTVHSATPCRTGQGDRGLCNFVSWYSLGVTNIYEFTNVEMRKLLYYVWYLRILIFDRPTDIWCLIFVNTYRAYQVFLQISVNSWLVYTLFCTRFILNIFNGIVIASFYNGRYKNSHCFQLLVNSSYVRVSTMTAIGLRSVTDLSPHRRTDSGLQCPFFPGGHHTYTNRGRRALISVS